MEKEKVKVLICTGGYKPVPDVQGGAVEHLTTEIILKNEINKDFNFYVITCYASKLAESCYKYIKIFMLKDWQKYISIKMLFFLINKFCSWLNIHHRYDYMSIAISICAKRIFDGEIILVENNLRIFFLVRRLFPDKKVIFHLHNDYDPGFKDNDKTLNRIKLLLKKADGILVASKYLYSRLSIVNSNAPIYLLQNCIDDRIFSPDRLKKDIVQEKRKKFGVNDEFVIMYVGRISQEKGIRELVKAIKLIRDINVKLLIVGDNWFHSKEEDQYKEELVRDIQDIEDKVIHLGYISQDEICIYYKISDLVVVPSQCNEAFGMVALEALSMGRPVIATAVGGLKEIIDDSCGRLIELDGNYIENLSSCIVNLYNDRKLLNKLGENAIVKAKDFNNPQKYYETFKEIIKHISNN